MPLRIRRGSNAERLTITPAEGELIYTTDLKRVYVGDGVSLGGVEITANAALESLTSNLNLNGFNIIGSGNVIIDGNIEVSDGDVFSNVVGNLRGSVLGNNFELLVDGDTGTFTGNLVGDVKGSVFADDSTIIVDITTNTFTGNFTGNLTGSVFADDSTTMVDITTNTFTGDLTGSVFADDFTLLVDATNKTVNANLISQSLLIKNNSLDISPEIIENTQTQSIHLSSNENASTLKLSRISTNDISDQNLRYGTIQFSRTDINDEIATGLIMGFKDSIVFAQDASGNFNNELSFLSFWQNKFGIGKVEPEEKLDVAGNAVIRGNLTVNSGLVNVSNFTSVERDELVPTNGSVIYNTTNNKFQGYANGEWVDFH
jgi:hypothetical protein